MRVKSRKARFEEALFLCLWRIVLEQFRDCFIDVLLLLVRLCLGVERFTRIPPPNQLFLSGVVYSQVELPNKDRGGGTVSGSGGDTRGVRRWPGASFQSSSFFQQLLK